MRGRPICSDDEAERRGFTGLAACRRRRVLHETLTALGDLDDLERYRRLAANDLGRSRSAATASVLPAELCVRVLPDDWGVSTLSMTRRYGRCFAVLNMASPDVPGGAYVEAAPAQEENMFRRTDCHFSVGPREYDVTRDRYMPAMSRWLESVDGRVFLDVVTPRVCLRGPELRSEVDLGYGGCRRRMSFRSSSCVLQLRTCAAASSSIALTQTDQSLLNSRGCAHAGPAMPCWGRSVTERSAILLSRWRRCTVRSLDVVDEISTSWPLLCTTRDTVPAVTSHFETVSQKREKAVHSSVDE